MSAVRTAASDLLEALCGSYDVDVAALQLPLAVNQPVRGRGGVTRDMVHTAIQVLEVSLHLDAEALGGALVLGLRFPPAGVSRCCCDLLLMCVPQRLAVSIPSAEWEVVSDWVSRLSVPNTEGLLLAALDRVAHASIAFPSRSEYMAWCARAIVQGAELHSSALLIERCRPLSDEAAVWIALTGVQDRKIAFSSRYVLQSSSVLVWTLQAYHGTGCTCRCLSLSRPMWNPLSPTLCVSQRTGLPASQLLQRAFEAWAKQSSKKRRAHCMN